MDRVKVVCPHCGGVNSIPKKDTYSKASCGHCKNSLLDTKPTNLNQQKFDNLVANSEVPIVVDFWAPWCGPCKMMAPAFESAASSFALKAYFAKVNTEEEQYLGGKFSIRSIPTMIIFKNNKEVDRVSGALSAAQIEEWVKKYI